MSKFIDLHTHSKASDGSDSPRELVRLAKESGLAAIAISDHDDIQGIEDALDEGKKIGLEVVAGVEIGVSFSTEMHILGYFFNDGYKELSEMFSKMKNKRMERNTKVVQKLNELGFKITMEEVIAEAGGIVLGRAHIATVMLKKGFVKSMPEAFEKYLQTGKVAYFNKDTLPPEECLEKLVKAGGIPVLAHPKFLYLNNSQMEETIVRLKKLGLRGIEAIYSENTADDTGYFLRLALKYDLLVTGGSDYHGKFKKHINIGTGRGNLKVPYELLEKLKAEAL